MEKLSYRMQMRQQKMYIKAYAVLCVIILGFMGFYGFKNWTAYSFVLTNIQNADAQVAVLRASVVDEKTKYENARTTHVALSKNIEKRLMDVFPSNDDYTNLTRKIDAFEKELTKSNKLFEISSLQYQSIIDEDHYSILPVRMSIRSSSDNFRKFLHMVENSGSLNDQIRLMDVSSIRLNFDQSKGEGNDSDLINFSVLINAYFQKSGQ